MDFVSKFSPFVQLDIVQIERELRRKILQWAEPRPAAAARPQVALPAGYRPIVAPAARVDLVAVGVSTGGPKIMPEFLRATGRLDCPMVIAQHMPALFTASLARHLAFDTGLDVMEGEDGLELRPRQVVVMTGMGCDGTIGARAFTARGFPVLVQSPESCVVGGMPGAVIEAGVSPLVLSLPEISRRLIRWCVPPGA